MKSFIDEDYLWDLIHSATDDAQTARQILQKAQKLKGLSLAEAATLLKCEDAEILAEMRETAGKVKEAIYGKRIVLFAPLYLSNECLNNCAYCGFRAGYLEAERKTLSLDEIIEQAKLLSEAGFRRVLIVSSENPTITSLNYICQAVEAIYKHSDIHIVHANIAPLEVDGFKRLKAAGVGVYQIFQETYHQPTYQEYHLNGPKKDYDYRLFAMDRAMQVGFGDVGLGVLYGLYDFRFDTLGILQHNQHLKQEYGSFAHTFSVPRMRLAHGSLLTETPYLISDADFAKVVAVLRLAAPQVGIVVTTREPAYIRDQIIHSGSSQISAGSRTDPGGYHTELKEHHPAAKQFEVSDTRNLPEIIKMLINEGLIPSLCTACYRSHRTGSNFHNLTEKAAIQRFCTPNALLSLVEYMQQRKYSEEMAASLQSIIKEYLEHEADPVFAQELQKRIKYLKLGGKDTFF